MKARSTNALGGTHFAGDVTSGVDDGVGVKLGTAQSGATVWIEPLSDDANASLGIRAKGTGIVTLVSPGLYNVKDYGATGDGVTDDYDAIVDALAAIPATGGILFFPEGTYAHGTGLNFAGADRRVVGQNATLYFTGTGVGVSFDAGLTTYYGCGMEQMKLRGNANATKGLYVNRCHHGRYINITIEDVTTTAAEFVNSVCNHVEDIRVSGNETTLSPKPATGLLLTTGNCVSNVVINPIIEGVSGTGIVLDAADSNNFFGGTSEGNARGVTLQNGSDFNSFDGMSCEANTVGDFLLDASRGNELVHCYGTSTTASLGTAGAALNNTVRASRFHNVAIESSAVGMRLYDVTYSAAGAGGTYTNAATRRIALGVYNAYTNSYEQNVAYSLLTSNPVEAVTTTKSPSAEESREIYTNEGDSDGATITLPTAVAQLEYSFYVHTGQTLTITAAAGDTIRISGNVTAAAGSITSSVVGSFVTLTAINATEWVGHDVVGSWSF